MPVRVFRSAAGAEWRVWSVIPGRSGHEERRRGYDRRSPDPVLKPPGAERRVATDRRKTSPAMGSFNAGWLVFESGEERRRLAPIPPGWEVRGERDLERLCGRAVPVAAAADPGDTN